MKTCTVCKETKPTSEYYLNSGGNHRNNCKPCYTEARLETTNFANRLRDFVVKSEGIRREDYRALPKDVRAQINLKYKDVMHNTNPQASAVTDPVKDRIKAELKAEYEVSDRKVSQRKEGYVYVIHNKAWPEWVKVGRSVLTERRFNSYQTSSPFRDYELAGDVYFEDAIVAERVVHSGLTAYGIESNGEWFKTTPDYALSWIQSNAALKEFAA